MPAPQALVDLVSRFEEQLEAYKSGAYNETQLRIDFLDPFFSLLGWDMQNISGHAEAYRDVIHEDEVRVGGALKAPDYGFRIGGTRKFFLEAKKPSVAIKDEIQPAYQLRRYAWSAKLPLSILSDFEEFAIYDCRIKPKPNDKASTARLFYCTYRDYVEKWDEIAAIFSKDAILKGSFDKYASSKGRRGTAEVDDDFLETIEVWRSDLARDLARRNPALTERDLNFAVQKIIDRIIFLRICEDRGMEDYGRLRALTVGPRIYPRLTELFRAADTRYNSGLFHFEPENGRDEGPDELTLDLEVDDKLLRDLLKQLYYPESPYEFRVLSSDILGQVYEQFLGKVIRLTASHKAEVEDKPEVKKAGGVYYTPTYIVDYIVRETVGVLIEGKTPKQIASIRVLDPACGSGSFLIGAYQFLLDWYLKYYTDHDPVTFARGKRPVLIQTPGGWRLSIEERKRILLAHIHGVDIDSQAVEVTKLSLLLKVLEGETSQSLQPLFQIFHERALPDLGNNIKCGNSLIGSDFYAQPDLPLLSDEEKLRINVFDWDGPRGFQHIMKEGGFDAVIGNPPYGASFTLFQENYLNTIYKSQNYQLDSYLLFIEQAMRLLVKGGQAGMIIPNTYLVNLRTTEIRRLLFTQTTLNKIVHFNKKVFSNATVDTQVVILANSRPLESHQIQIHVSDTKKVLEQFTVPQQRWGDANGQPVNVLTRPAVGIFSDRISSLPKLDTFFSVTQGAKPFQVGKGKPKQTRKIVDEKPFVAESRKDTTFRPLLRGSLINRYQIYWENNYWISFGDWLAEPRYSASYDAPQKIIIRQTGDSLIATLDREQFIVRDNLYTIIPLEEKHDLRLLLAILNSTFATWFYQNAINPEKGEALAQVKRGHLASFPIPLIFLDPELKTNTTVSSRIVALVDDMLALYRKRSVAKNPPEQAALDAQISATDTQIDQLVYALYGLTEEEIRIVEETA